EFPPIHLSGESGPTAAPSPLVRFRVHSHAPHDVMEGWSVLLVTTFPVRRVRWLTVSKDSIVCVPRRPAHRACAFLPLSPGPDYCGVQVEVNRIRRAGGNLHSLHRARRSMRCWPRMLL